MSASEEFPTLAQVAVYSHAKVSLVDLHAEAGKALDEIDVLRGHISRLNREIEDLVGEIQAAGEYY